MTFKCGLSLATALVLLAQSPVGGQHGILVFAPHPDDEALGCSGVILQALAQGKPVNVVLLTNGDGITDAAAALVKKPVAKLLPEDYLQISRFRQGQTRAALAVLGAKPDAAIMLGYPDSGLDQVYRNASATPFQQKFTHKTATYALVQQDYHTAAHGSPAPYTRAAALADTAELIKTLEPSQVYVTSEADSHPDHRAAFWIVRDAIQAAGYHGEFLTYLIHNGSGHQWPWPRGVTPQAPFESHRVKGEQIPRGVPWPPSKRVPLTPGQAQTKLKAIRAHTLFFSDPAQNEDHQANMESFVKSEEVFWAPGVN